MAANDHVSKTWMAYFFLCMGLPVTSLPVGKHPKNPKVADIIFSANAHNVASWQGWHASKSGVIKLIGWDLYWPVRWRCPWLRTWAWAEQRSTLTRVVAPATTFAAIASPQPTRHNYSIQFQCHTNIQNGNMLRVVTDLEYQEYHQVSIVD